jgi:class 3 adenylate cyclase/tetratricopeptide (TPR) repeat protein
MCKTAQTREPGHDFPEALPSHRLRRATRTILVIDIAESARLVEQDEEGAVSRWLDLVRHIRCHVLPVREGRLVKDLGDGALLEFKDVLTAVSAAFAIHHAANRGNLGAPPDRHMLLRMGIEVGEVMLDHDNVFGRGAIVAQRLTTLAGPGETIITAHVREQLTPDLDADIEDLGDCFLKHVSVPVRAYRIGPPGPHPVIEPWIPASELMPSVAVVPFMPRDPDPRHFFLGEVLAEEITQGLSRSPELRVISRLSTTSFRGRDATLREISAHLNANYVLSGMYHVSSRRLVLEAELAEAKSGCIVWTRHFDGPLAAILKGEQELIGQLLADVSAAVISRELQRARTQPLPTLKSYTLLMAGVALMHRLSLGDFEEARHLLQTLLDRARRQPVPQAWLGKWHVLRVLQGWSPDPAQDARQALQCTQQALDADPQCSLALAVDGFAHTNLLRRLDIAQGRYERAIQANPSDSLAWLLKGTMHAFMGDGTRAVEETQRALMLSPLDPHRYFFESLAGTAYLSAGRYDAALDLASRSLRANRMHISTLRVMAIAQHRLGMGDDARRTVQEILRLDPTFTISKYLARTPAEPFVTGKDWSDALRQAGVPA